MIPDTFWLQVLESAIQTTGLLVKEFWWLFALAAATRLLRMS